mgnify:FL=1
MKYLITESQFDKIIFDYLDSQKFFALKDRGDIELYPSETHWREHLSYAIIAFHNKYQDCYVSCDLLREISNFFPIPLEDSLDVVRKWFSHNYAKVDDVYSDCGAD